MRSPLYACLTFCFPLKIKLFFLGIAQSTPFTNWNDVIVFYEKNLGAKFFRCPNTVIALANMAARDEPEETGTAEKARRLEVVGGDLHEINTLNS